jgi:hypothetical protein
MPETLPCGWPLGCRRMAYGYDHDHITDRVRFALCKRHNLVLASCGDQAATLRFLADCVEQADLGFTYHEYRLVADRARGFKYRGTTGAKAKQKARSKSWYAQNKDRQFQQVAAFRERRKGGSAS